MFLLAGLLCYAPTLMAQGSLKRHERNPGKMTVTTASGLLPAGMAVYVQRGPNGVGLETRYSAGLQGFTSKRRTSEPNRERPAWEAGSSEDGLRFWRNPRDFRLIGVCRDDAPGVGILNELAGTCAGNGRRRIGAAHGRRTWKRSTR